MLDNKRIIKNTLMLYFRHILIMLVNLYAVREILSILGVEDYGIYTVVGGVVSMFSFFNTTMASASQRFFSFALGKGDNEGLRKVFAVNWIIYALIALTALALLETIGLWFVCSKLVILPERLEAAMWIYQFSILSFLCSILTTPFMAMIIAHEDMNIYAYVSIFEALLKLAIIFVLALVSFDKLQLYGFLILISTFLTSLIYVSISKKRYVECQFHLLWNKRIFKEILGFTGWSVFGSLSVVLRNQAVTILLNQMFNPVVVTVRSIAMQVASNVNVFSNNFNVGLYPPIIKSYAAGEKKQMLSLMFNGSKVTYFLMYLFTLPLLLEMPYILNLWLKNPPEGCVIFARLALIDALITAVSLPLMTAVRATGKVKVYELSLGSILIVSFFVSWFVLYLGAEAYIVMVVAILSTILMFIFRLILLKRVLDFSIFLYIREVVFPLLFMTLLSFVIAFLVSLKIPENLALLSILFSLIIACLCMYFIAINKNERKIIHSVIADKIKSIKK